MWTEAVVALFEDALVTHLPGETDHSHHYRSRESPDAASSTNIVTSSTFFLVLLCLVCQMGDVYRL
jgi:hypothetical protein